MPHMLRNLLESLGNRRDKAPVELDDDQIGQLKNQWLAQAQSNNVSDLEEMLNTESARSCALRRQVEELIRENDQLEMRVQTELSERKALEDKLVNLRTANADMDLLLQMDGGCGDTSSIIEPRSFGGSGCYGSYSTDKDNNLDFDSGSQQECITPTNAANDDGSCNVSLFQLWSDLKLFRVSSGTQKTVALYGKLIDRSKLKDYFIANGAKVDRIQTITLLMCGDKETYDWLGQRKRFLSARVCPLGEPSTGPV